MRSSFEWLVAARYLRLLTPRTAGMFIPVLIAALVVACTFGLDWATGRVAEGFWADFHALYQGALLWAEVGTVAAFILVAVFSLLAWRLTIFTTISIYGLFLGTAALVIVLSVMSGFELDLKRKILGAHAHVVVTSTEQAFTDYAGVRERLARETHVRGASAYLTDEVMISSRSNLEGVILKGIDPATVGSVTDLQRNMTLGDVQFLLDPDKADLARPRDLFDEDERPPQPTPGRPERAPAARPAPSADSVPARKPRPGVIVGRELAKTLMLFMGDEVTIVSPFGGIGPTGPIPKARAFKVVGIFYTGMFEYDSKYAYVALDEAQRFLGQPGEVTGVELKIDDPDHSEELVQALTRAAGPGYEVQDWKMINRSLFTALKIEKIAMFVVLCFIVLVAAFSIVANGVMLVMEKGREIAILKSMGAADRALLTVFLVMGLYMGGLGTALGVVAGVLACVWLDRYGLPLNADVYYITRLPVRMSPAEIATVASAALLIALAATLYPAWVAGRMRPVEILREE